MLYPVEEFIKNQDLLCVSEQETVRDALTKMLEHNYSQLPIVNKDGDLTGIISEKSVARSYYHFDEQVSVLDLKVNSCREVPATVTIEQDVFEALDDLNKVYAVVVINGCKPVGIITSFDTTNFFRDLSEGLILVEDIEVTLRQYIEELFPTEKDLQNAMYNTFRKRMEPDSPRPLTYDRMTLGEYILLITTHKNWDKFEDLLESRDLFRVYMNQVREIRNQLAHFRGRVDPIQYDVLVRARDWLASRPIEKFSAKPAKITEFPASQIAVQASGKYGRLEDFLKDRSSQARSGSEIQLTFSQIEELIGDKLPPSAKEHRSWWANDPATGRQSMAWMRSGWNVENVDFTAGTVTFRRRDTVLYHVFFEDLRVKLKEQRPSLTRSTKAYPRSYWGFSGGRSGISFGWAFTGSDRLQTDLYIDTGDKVKNKEIFDTLFKEKEAIEQEFGAELVWERLDHRQASRISTSIPVTIRDDQDTLEQAKVWALKSLQDLVDTFQKRIKKLPA